MPSEKYMLEVAEGNKMNISRFFFSESLGTTCLLCQSILWVYLMQMLQCVFHGHIYACTRNFVWTAETLHQRTSKLIANAVQGQIWGSHFLEEFPAREDVLEVMLVWLFWEPAGWEGDFFLITGVLFLLLNTLLGSSLFTKESASSERRAVLMVMGLYMLNHCWKAGWRGRKRLKSNCN